MSVFMNYLIGTILAVAVVGILQLFPWPELPAIISTILEQVFGILFLFDRVFPVATAIQILMSILAIETWLWIIRFILKLYQFVTGTFFSSGKNTDL